MIALINTVKSKTINVSKNAIRAATILNERDFSRSCTSPIALALNSQTEIRGWFISEDNKQALTDCGRKIELPEIAVSFMDKWTSFKDVKPISFEIEGV